MSEPERVDFKKIIAELEAAGTSLYKIALMMHRQYTQVKRWRDGKKEPLFHEGQMLLAIHADATRETLQGVTISSTNPVA
jgi:hypothetical protein